MGGLLDTISPFFAQNSNIRRLRVSLRGRSTPSSVQSLSTTLTGFNTLRVFDCRNSKIGDHDVEVIILALAGHSQLTKIDLSQSEVGGRALAALVGLMNNNSSLADLDLWDCSIDDEGALIFVAALDRNSTLKKLNLRHNHDITNRGWRAIFTQLGSPQSSLEDVDLSGRSIIDDAAAVFLANVLTNGTNLKVLKLGSNYGITTEGWQALFVALQGPRCMLQELSLNNNGFNDEDVTYLANSLANNCVLRELDLSDNERVTASGWRTFSAVLQNPDSALEKINIRYISIGDDVLVLFVNSLVNNTKLRELLLDGWVEEGVAPINWEALCNVLCNKSSIDATFNSNHTLQRVFHPTFAVSDDSQLPSDLRDLLQLNRGSTKFESARRKILKVHFSGDFSMQPFIDMDWKVLPHAVAWMARDEYGSSLLYQFVRNTGLFHDVEGATQPEN